MLSLPYLFNPHHGVDVPSPSPSAGIWSLAAPLCAHSTPPESPSPADFATNYNWQWVRQQTHLIRHSHRTPTSDLGTSFCSASTAAGT